MARILIADDDLEILELLKFTFENEQYEVITASDGAEAMTKAMTEKPDIMVLDVNMPKMTGYEVCETLREQTSTSAIPLILLTSLTKTKDRITGIKMGADEYLGKPFETYELLARVEGLLKRTKENQAASTLTGLPGFTILEHEIRQRFGRGTPQAIMIFDVVNLQTYNTQYGFDKGDAVITFIADTIKQSVADVGTPGDIIVHDGGDNFLLVTDPTSAQGIAERSLLLFDKGIQQYYDATATIASSKNTSETNSLALAIGIALTTTATYHHYSQIIERAKEMLRKAQSLQTSSFRVG